MFIVLLNYIKPLEEVDKYLIAHRAFLDDCYQQNLFVVSGPQEPRTGGVMVSNLTDKNQLEKIIAQDPFYQQQIAEYKIIEFHPVKYHPDFARFLS